MNCVKRGFSPRSCLQIHIGFGRLIAFTVKGISNYGKKTMSLSGICNQGRVVKEYAAESGFLKHQLKSADVCNAVA